MILRLRVAILTINLGGLITFNRQSPFNYIKKRVWYSILYQQVLQKIFKI